MGNTVEKLAFQPPEKDYAVSLLRPHEDGSPVRFRKTRSGTTVSFIHFKPSQLRTTTASSCSPTASSTGNDAPPTVESPLVLLWSHGNAEDLGYGYSAYVKVCRSLNVDVVAFDYSGYGCSSGAPSESQTFDDIQSMYDYLTTDCKVPPSRIVVVGRSLGSGPATDLAAKEPGLAGLILIAPLTSAISIAGAAPRFLLQSMDIFENYKKVPKLRTFPVYVIHGRLDKVVPFAHGVKLLDILRTSVAEGGAGNALASHWWVDRCGHNDIEALEGERFYTNLRQFIRSIVPPASTGV